MDAAARFRRSLLLRLLRASAASALVLAGLGAAGCGESNCIKPAQAGACPSREEAKSLIGVDCGERLVSVDSDAEVDGDLCGDEITTENEDNACCPPDCVIGRPFMVPEAALIAEMPSVLAGHGCLDDAIRDAVMARAMAEVVVPCARVRSVSPRREILHGAFLHARELVAIGLLP